MPFLPAQIVAAEGASTLPMPSYAYGILALAVFALLLAVLWAFRGTANKHEPAQRHTPGSQVAGAHQGRTHDGDGH